MTDLSSIRSRRLLKDAETSKGKKMATTTLLEKDRKWSCHEATGAAKPWSHGSLVREGSLDSKGLGDLMGQAFSDFATTLDFEYPS